jgi:hypothetical protein
MPVKRPLSERFWEKVAVGEPDQCWEWTSAKIPVGYGQFFLQGKPRYAHRVAFEMTKGEVPPEMNVLHTCDNPGCCNPDHLWLGTQQDNVRDMMQKGRANWAKKGMP